VRFNDIIYIIFKHIFLNENSLIFGLETWTGSHYLVLNFYQINEDCEIRTRDRLIIKALIPCQRTNLTQKLKLLGEIPRYDLYYSLTIILIK